MDGKHTNRDPKIRKGGEDDTTNLHPYAKLGIGGGSINAHTKSRIGAATWFLHVVLVIISLTSMASSVAISFAFPFSFPFFFAIFALASGIAFLVLGLAALTTFVPPLDFILEVRCPLLVVALIFVVLSAPTKEQVMVQRKLSGNFFLAPMLVSFFLASSSEKCNSCTKKSSSRVFLFAVNALKNFLR